MESKIDADARREARRRRILQNSGDRLRKIRGYDDEDVQSKGTTDDATGQATLLSSFPPVFEVARDDFTETKHFPLETTWQRAESEDVMIPSSQDIQKSPVSSKLCNARVHIIVLAAVVRLLLFTGHGYLFSNRVLVPLMLVLLAELAIPGTRPAVSSGGVLGAAMMLSGLAQSRVHGMLRGACILRTLCVDLALYLFTFCLTHTLLQVM